MSTTPLAIAWQADDGSDRLSLLVDGSPWRSVHVAIFGRRPKMPKMAASWQEWQVTFLEMEYRQVRHYLLKRLAVQGYHSRQLQKLLLDRLVSPATIERSLQECQAAGWLDDEAWLDAYIAAKRRLMSSRAIAAKLQAKGLSRQAAEQALLARPDLGKEQGGLARLLAQRLARTKADDPRAKQKVFQALLRRGYAFGAIQAAWEDWIAAQDSANKGIL